MRALRTFALALSVTACIPLVPRSGTSSSTGGAGDPSGTPPPTSTSTSSTSASEPTAPAPAGPQTVSVTIRSACGQTVKVFYGDSPGFSSGTTSSISSNSVQSKTFQVGDQMWVLDDAGKGAGSVTMGAGTRNVEIASNCESIAAR